MSFNDYYMQFMGVCTSSLTNTPIIIIIINIIIYAFNYNRQCLRLAFMAVIQKELDEIVIEWNSHYVRKQRHLTSPCGIPEKLFTLPELYGMIL